MVARRVSQKPVLILDLDGTVLAVNSFPRWVRFMIVAPLPHLSPARRLALAAGVAFCGALRKARLLGHERFKWHLQRLWQAAVANDDGASERRFAAKLSSDVRTELRPLLDAIASGAVDAVLATAAAGDYAQAFGRSLGFAHVLATQTQRCQDEESNVGERKCDVVRAFLATHGWLDRPRIVFTDHVEDMPLIALCDTLLWFGSEKSRWEIARAFPGIVVHAGVEAAGVLLTELVPHTLVS